MTGVIGIVNQDFEKIRVNNYFYIDKTSFIQEWWEAADEVTLIARPRRFGKTLNMSMLEKFFSVKYQGRGDLFQGLNIWEGKSPDGDYKYRKLQGTYPVISLSFADIKETTFLEARQKICKIIQMVYNQFDFLLEGDILNENEKNDFRKISADMENYLASLSLKMLTDFLNRYYGKKVIFLLDEYDTPMQEAYVNGYWDELASFTRSLFNSTFKKNPHLERAVMTEITRVSNTSYEVSESIFSDLNNLEVVTTTSQKYADCFGFTEEEVFACLTEFGLSDWKQKVKDWYDGFSFGERKDIYNPWSIIHFLDKKAASAYLKVSGRAFEERTGHMWYDLALTNKEVHIMFADMVQDWFSGSEDYNDFIRALLLDDIKAMNVYMNRVSIEMFSSFDTGRGPSGKRPECFYHGFVLGLMVELSDRYVITSNRESGFGRYDVMLEPRMAEGGIASNDGILMEFKVQDEDERELSDTVRNALRQIEEKGYQSSLIAKGIPEKRIRKYGFAFCGKKVLIGRAEKE